MNRTTARWFALEHLEPRQLLATVTWDGGGGDNEWGNPLNWSGDALPGLNDAVVIDAAGQPTVHVSTGATANIASLVSHDPLDIRGGSLFVGGSWSQRAGLTVSSGNGEGGAVSLDGDVLMTGGSLGGAISLRSGRRFTIDGDTTLTGPLDNSGFLEWRSGTLTTYGQNLQATVVINNRAGATFLIKSSGSLNAWFLAEIVNSGTMVVDAAPGTTTNINIALSNTPATLTSAAGTVDDRSGRLHMLYSPIEQQGDTLTGGNWYVSSSNAVLLFPTDVLHVNGRVVLNGAGAAFPAIEHANTFEDLTLSGGRAFTMTPDPLAVSSINRLTINNPGMTTVIPVLHGHELNIHGGRVDILAGMDGSIIRVDAGTVLVLSGISRLPFADVSGAGLIRVKGELDWPSGTIAGPGQLVITETGHLQMTGQYYEYFDKILTRRVINNGTMDWHEFPYSISLGSEVVNRGVWNLDITGYLSTISGVGPGFTPAYIGNYGVINSFASVTVRGAGGAVRLLNLGTIRAFTGSLIFNGGVYGSGNFIAETGAELVFGGFGTVLSNPVMSGGGRIREAARAIWLDPHIDGVGDFVVTPPADLTLFGTDIRITRSTFYDNGRVTIGDGSTAVVRANVVNSAILQVNAGTLNIAGNLALTATSTLRIKSTSVQPHLCLSVSGNSHLAGALVVSYAWAAPLGSVFDFMFTASHDGMFASIEGEGAPVGLPLLTFIGGYARLTLVVT
jgi:hypothetical protein